MDYFSHGIWSYIFFHKIKKPLYAVLFGIMPDTISWVPFVFYRIFSGQYSFGPPDPLIIPDWVWFLYGLSHSLIVFVIVALLLFALFRKIPIYVWAWPLHIIIDIFTHTREYLSTPFLWPVSDYAFPGISWGTPWFMIPNLSLMVLLLILIYLKQRPGKGVSTKE